ncbi:UNVERIFIED_CONTAM: hypothetical protein PYX00_008620 [Menopon gallinae]|uniref:G kinase-anchoring protein 1 n=1 Tax=Menopon gallinae TaxID=328185 RepID=A0AAW2HNR2_9NEOP
MATTVASRYAVLSLDEDDDYSSRKKKSPNKKPVEVKPNNTTSIKSDTNFKKKKKSNLQVQNAKPRNKSTNNSAGSNKKKYVSIEQWEEWKQKDAQFVEGNYEDELSQAILLSKLEYEEKKDLYESAKKNEEQKKNQKKNKKNQKPGNESNNIGNKVSNENTSIKSVEKQSQKTKNDGESRGKLKSNKFEEAPKEEIDGKKKARESFSQEALILAKYEDTLEKRDKEIIQLKEEVEKLKGQLYNVKNRNKKLCEIIANGEMKDKAEVLMEVERLQTVKDELSSEVVNLHAQLEQERSKVRALSGNEHKTKDKMLRDKKCVRFHPTVSVIG